MKAIDTDSSEPREADCIITLVHGTWPWGFWRRRPPQDHQTPCWYEPDSDFAKEIRARLEAAGLACEIHPFVWSGLNSMDEREQASKLLAENLRCHQTRNARALHAVIAHSHGGNVTLRALWHLGSSEHPLCVATMGTPFVSVQSVPPEFRRFKAFRPMVLVIWMTTCIALLLLLSGLGFTFENWLFDLPLTLVCWLSSAFLVDWLVKWLAGPYGSDSSGRENKADRYQRVTEYAASTRESTRLLVVRAVDDEASLGIAVGAIAARILNLGLGVLARIGPVVATLALIGAIFMTPAAADLVPSLAWGQPTDWFWTSVGVIVAVVGGFMGLMLLASLAKAVYGRELALGSARCDVSAQSVPDVSGAIEVVTLRPSFEQDDKLRHAIHEIPECRSLISAWLIRYTMDR